MHSLSALELSAIRAFLGRIHPEMRAVKVWIEGDLITVTVILDREASDRVRMDVSEAAAEIVADYLPQTRIAERLIVSESLPLADDGRIGGWIFERAE